MSCIVSRAVILFTDQMPNIKGSHAIVWHTIVKSLTILKILTSRFVSIEDQLIQEFSTFMSFWLSFQAVYVPSL